MAMPNEVYFCQNYNSMIGVILWNNLSQRAVVSGLSINMNNVCDVMFMLTLVAFEIVQILDSKYYIHFYA